MEQQETIFAIATPPGFGGIGVIRISGPAAAAIADQLLGRLPQPRHAALRRFLDEDGTAIDSGIALYFPAPASFTGEDILEIQGHGGPVVQQLLCHRLMLLGARAARAGEFLERAYLNDKLDLAQAEAIADLIESGTAAAARAAQHSLDGELSRRVHALQQRLTGLRVFVEAALDFPDEEIDFIADSDVTERLQAILDDNRRLREDAHQGRLLRDGITIAIFGQPNAGKSSLLNALSGRDSAIVTDIPGTTRDVLRETISLEGLPVHVADTAGIREAADAVEAEGVRRARHTLAQADLALLVIDCQQPAEPQLALREEVPADIPCIEVYNKIDLETDHPVARADPANRRVWLSARTGSGMAELTAMVRDLAGVSRPSGGAFSARTRHLDALRRVSRHLEQGARQLAEFTAAETLAEELRLAQRALGEITGEVLPDDLLGEIFASFCIGK
jgi:tRNA modification GTPase